MKLSTTLILAVLLSGLSFYYFAIEKPASPVNPEIFSPKVLSLTEGDSFSFLQIENQASKPERIGLKRKDSEWVMVAPVYYPAENFLVEGMLQALTFSERDRQFSRRDPLAKEFGFDSPSVTITIKTEKRPDPRTLLLGVESPLGTGVYARWAGEDKIFLVSSQLAASFERTVYSLRRKKLFRLDWDKVTWMFVKMGVKKFRLEKKEGLWHWVVPALKEEIPLEKAMDLIYSFQSLYVKEFLDGRHTDEKEFGFSKEILIAAGDESGNEERLILGAKAKGKDALFAFRESENLVLLVSEKNLKSLLENFEITFHILENESSKKASGNQGSDSKDSDASRQKPLRGQAGAGDKDRSH